MNDTKYIIKHAFYLNGKYAQPGYLISGEEYEQACLQGYGDRMVVEGFFPPSLKSSEELKAEIAKLQEELDKRKAEQALSNEAESKNNSDKNFKKSKKTN